MGIKIPRLRINFITICLFILLSSFSSLALFWLEKNYNSEYLQNKAKDLEIAYNTIFHSYLNCSKMLFENRINRSSVLEIFKDAHNSSIQQQDVIRKKMYDNLKSFYFHINDAYSIRQLHFHLPDGTSFLRFHKPDKYGDKLNDVRYSVKIVNKTRQPIQGFEEGRVQNGFRYVYPLNYKGTHIGSVEISISFDAIKEDMEKLFLKDYRFIIKKEVVDKKVFDEEKKNYILAKDISVDFMYENSNRKTRVLKPKILKQLNLQLRDQIKSKLLSGEQFGKIISYEGTYYEICYLPVYNTLNEHVAYIISYFDNPLLKARTYNFYFKLLLWNAIVLLIFIFIVNYKKQTNLIKEHNQKLDMVTHNLKDAVYMLDQNKRIIFCNPAFRNLLGISEKKTIIGTYIHDHIDFLDDNDQLIKPELCPVCKTIETGDTFSTEDFKVICSDNTTISAAIYSRPIYNKGEDIIGSLVVFNDITERKRFEKLKGDIDRIIRHDLKNPLNAIINVPQLLLKDISDPEHIELLNMIQDAGNRMLNLINFSLDMYKLETGGYQLRIEETNIIQILHSIIKEFSFELERKSISYEILEGEKSAQKTDTFTLSVDKNLVYFLFSNLIKNAIDASPKNGKLKIQIKKEEKAKISIQNEGTVPIPIRNKFFEKYTTHGKTNGTGLGTYSARLIVRAHSGEISMNTSDEENKTQIEVVF